MPSVTLKTTTISSAAADSLDLCAVVVWISLSLDLLSADNRVESPSVAKQPPPWPTAHHLDTSCFCSLLGGNPVPSAHDIESTLDPTALYSVRNNETYAKSHRALQAASAHREHVASRTHAGVCIKKVFAADFISKLQSRTMSNQTICRGRCVVPVFVGAESTAVLAGIRSQRGCRTRPKGYLLASGTATGMKRQVQIGPGCLSPLILMYR